MAEMKAIVERNRQGNGLFQLANALVSSSARKEKLSIDKREKAREKKRERERES